MAKNDFTPESDIEWLTHAVAGQADVMGALFRTIARLSDDKDVVALCAHGALQASLQANDIDGVREHVEFINLK